MLFNDLFVINSHPSLCLTTVSLVTSHSWDLDVLMGETSGANQAIKWEETKKRFEDYRRQGKSVREICSMLEQENLQKMRGKQGGAGFIGTLALWQARIQVLRFGGEDTFLGGKVFSISYMFKKIIPGARKFGGYNKSLGVNCPRLPPVVAGLPCGGDIDCFYDFSQFSSFLFPFSNFYFLFFQIFQCTNRS